jgi:hypothetical protein
MIHGNIQYCWVPTSAENIEHIYVQEEYKAANQSIGNTGTKGALTKFPSSQRPSNILTPMEHPPYAMS